MGQATKVASGAATSVALGISILSLSSPMAIWFLANQFQLFSLFLLTNTDLPNDIVEYIKGNAFFSFSMDFLPFTQGATSNGLMSKMDKNQTYSDLQNIGVESQSAFVNSVGLMMTFVIFIIIHIGLY